MKVNSRSIFYLFLGVFCLCMWTASSEKVNSLRRRLANTDNNNVQESPEDKALRSIQEYKKKFGLKTEPRQKGASVQAVETTVITDNSISSNGNSDASANNLAVEGREKRKRKRDGSKKKGRKGDRKKKSMEASGNEGGRENGNSGEAGNEFDEFTNSYKRASKQLKKTIRTTKMDLQENDSSNQTE